MFFVEKQLVLSCIFRSDNLQSLPRNAGVVMYNVTFPTSHPSNYIVPETDMHGHPQVSLCMLGNYSPALKRGSYIGFGLSVGLSVLPSVIISFPLNILRTLIKNLSKFCFCIDIDMV